MKNTWVQRGHLGLPWVWPTTWRQTGKPRLEYNVNKAYKRSMCIVVRGKYIFYNMILPSINCSKRNKRKKDVGKRPINSSCSPFLPFSHQHTQRHPVWGSPWCSRLAWAVTPRMWAWAIWGSGPVCRSDVNAYMLSLIKEMPLETKLLLKTSDTFLGLQGRLFWVTFFVFQVSNGH